MNLNRIFKSKMYEMNRWDTFVYLYGPKNPDKKKQRKIIRKRMKKDKFYNGFYEFLEMQKINSRDGKSE